MDLSQKKTGFTGVISKLEGEDFLLERLRELGFLCGETIRILSIAPFGDPLVVQVSGTRIALRKVEARCLKVS